MLNVLYLSAVCTNRLLDQLFKNARVKPQLAAQKFHRLLVEGLQTNPNTRVTAITNIPVSRASHSRVIWCPRSEEQNGVRYSYIPFINLPFLKGPIVFLFSFVRVLMQPILKADKTMVLCDTLNLSMSIAARLATYVTRQRCIGTVTDIPGQIVAKEGVPVNLSSRIYHYLSRWSLSRFDGYVLLTRQMNELVNPRKKPFMIMEGLVDIQEKNREHDPHLKTDKKIVLYAGGLFAKYGVKNLIDAFLLVQDPRAELHLYGRGKMEDEIIAIAKETEKVVFHGIVPNNVVVEALLKAVISVNPRPTTEEFTKYSFPSKNMEYMVSGTPLITTRLPGMPNEYLNHVYLFEEETVMGMAKCLEEKLALPEIERQDFGAKAKEFVLREKNNVKQGARIINFAKELKK